MGVAKKKSLHIASWLYAYRDPILVISFVLTLIIFWPGIFMHDSAMQYKQALSGIYGDHHPPLMAFLWRHLNAIYAGPGLMFVLQLLLLYLAVFVLFRVADKMALINPKWATILLLILPIYPQVLIYAIVVLKDVQYAGCFLLSAAILAYYTITKRRPNLITALILLVLLVYGAAIKFHGQYTVVVLAVWFGSLLCIKKSFWFRACSGLAIYALIFVAISFINYSLTDSSQKNYAWEYVKLYDLAALSIQLHKDLIPNFNKTIHFSQDRLQAEFRYPAVDSLVFMNDPLLKTTRNHQEMHQLKQIWTRNVRAHPFLYLKHRLTNLGYILLASPGWSGKVRDVPLRFVNNLPANSSIYPFVGYLLEAVFFLFMSHLPIILLGVGYFGLSVATWRNTKAAPILLAFTATALLMVLLLFLCSMAGTPRYTYMPVLMIHGAHIFAYSCLRSIKYGKL